MRIPAPNVNPAPVAGTHIAVLAGGCFWGVQGVFQHVEGVERAVVGYAGGDAADAQYAAVATGRTGHAEAVQLVFAADIIGYGDILQIFFSVAHDPTQRDRQGPDNGRQYRSAIFPQDEQQARMARAYIDQLNADCLERGSIVTTIETGAAFYPAEGYHQDYMARHPSRAYIAIHDLPKVNALKALFPERFRPSPRLVAHTGM